MLTDAFSGRTGRSLATDFVKAATAADTPPPAAYPIQRALTAVMRAEGNRANDLRRIQAWAGQSSALGRPCPAAALANGIWSDAQALLH